MTKASFNVVGIGNAIVDVLASVDYKFMCEMGFEKGSMSLIDAKTASVLYDEMEIQEECSGGSAANTVSWLSSLGGKSAFIGKVRDDSLGRVFEDNIRKLGVAFGTKPSGSSSATARCLIFVTPDAERTMKTYLGACAELSSKDIDEQLIISSEITFLEGYLWDSHDARDALVKAAKIAKNAGRKVALTLSDALCVDRHRYDFIELIDENIDILFANEEEITSLYEVDDFERAIKKVADRCALSVLTRGERGSVLVTDNMVKMSNANTVKPVDTTGAGDAYAGGFLFGLSQNKSLEDCAKLGTDIATKVISQFGARPKIK